jgi:hypothetical protein
MYTSVVESTTLASGYSPTIDLEVLGVRIFHVFALLLC